MTEQEYNRLVCEAHGHYWIPIHRKVSIVDYRDTNTEPEIEPIHAFCITCGRRYEWTE